MVIFKKNSFIAVALTGLFSLMGSALAPGADSIGDEIDAIIQPLIDEKKNVGVAVGYIRAGESATMGYGVTSLEGGMKPRADTLFEIGSITKVFTATLLADLADDGVVELDAPVQSYLPEGVRLNAYTPEGGGEKQHVSLLQLSTQTSGMYRLPNNMKPADVQNPYADYSVELLYAYLENAPLGSRPGTRYLYSNTGVGLLGHALALANGGDYERSVIDRICDPLGLNDTRITLDSDQEMRFAQGYAKHGTPAKNWDLPTIAGAGALRSTVDDMLRFISFNIGLEDTELRSAMDATHGPRFKISESMSIGMGWHILSIDELSEPVVWHNGGTGGSRTFAGFMKDAKLGVVVLSNTAASVDEAALEILKLLAR